MLARALLENGRTAGARFRLRPRGQSLPGHFQEPSPLGQTLPEAEAVDCGLSWGFARREGEEHKVWGEREKGRQKRGLGLLERGWVAREALLRLP